MYYRLLGRCGYKTDGYYPSTRYDECDDVDYHWWEPVDESCTKIIKECIKKKEKHMDYNNTKIFVDGLTYNASEIEITENYGEFPKITATAYLSPSNSATGKINYGGHRVTPAKKPTITNVIFNPPATIVFWSDNTKTIVKCDADYDWYDPEKGIAMAIAKKVMGDNKGRYYEMFKHWREKWDKQIETTEKVTIDIPKNPVEKILNDFKSAFDVDDLLP